MDLPLCLGPMTDTTGNHVAIWRARAVSVRGIIADAFPAGSSIAEDGYADSEVGLMIIGK